MKIIKKCEICKKEFTSYRNTSKFCNRICYLKFHSKGTKKCYCKECGKIFNTERNRLKTGRGIYCSRQCSDKNSKILLRKRTIRYCKYCNKKFEIVTSRIKKYGYGNFCSYFCFKENRINMIANGTFNPNSNFNNGIYTSKISKRKEYYSSGYELIRMKQLDDLKLKWTKKHGIKIEYVDKNGILRKYIPDFLIENKILEEVKPYNMLKFGNNPLKFKILKKYCKINNLNYNIITEKELGIK